LALPKTLSDGVPVHHRTVPVLLVAIGVAVTAQLQMASAAPPASVENVTIARALTADTPRLPPAALDVALRAASCAAESGVVRHPEILTLIDYSRASTRPRLWVIDVAHRRVLFEELVAHGRETGGNLAERFSNEEGSLQSSLGVFLTADTYIGENGYSLRLDGLEPGFNDRARARAIVMHGAAYVRPGMEAQGRLGRSWGCPALSLSSARPVIDTIKGGSLVVAYYPEASWLQRSHFLNGCGTGLVARNAN
jgi:hypothetical protein